MKPKNKKRMVKIDASGEAHYLTATEIAMLHSTYAPRLSSSDIALTEKNFDDAYQHFQQYFMGNWDFKSPFPKNDVEILKRFLKFKRTPLVKKR